MITETEYFSQWVERFKTLVREESPALKDKFSIEADRDERGCVIPYMTTAHGIGKEDIEGLTRLWKIFLKDNPY